MKALSEPVQLRPVPRSRFGRRRLWLVAVLAFLNFGFGYWSVPLMAAWHNIRAIERIPAPVPPREERARTTGASLRTAATTEPQQTDSAYDPGAAPALPPANPTEPPTAVVSSTATVLPTPEPTPEPTPAPADAVTVLLLGVDARPAEGQLARSDTVMVARLDPARGRVVLLSLPRDLWTSIPGVGEGKLNTAYFIGERHGQGAVLVRETVEKMLGITIDYTAGIDFAGFRDVIDSLGGITVDVPRELYDPRFPTDDYGYTIAHFLPGPQNMNGEQALMYSRIRHPDSDFQRMRRQQQVVLAIAQRVRERGILRALNEADKLTAAVQPHVRTDMPTALALRLMWGLRDLNLSTVEQITVDSNLLTETNIGGAYALVDTAGALPAVGARLVGAP